MFDRSVLDVNHTVVTCITTLPTANALVIISSPDERIRADTQHVIIAAASATIAVLTAVIALAALQNALVVLVFLSSSMLIGGAMGVTNNAYAEIISRMLTAARRNDLVLNQQALGAILTVAATLLLIPLLSNRDAVDSHLDLLWFGAAAMAVAIVAAMTVGPTTSGTVSPPRGMIEDLREGAAAVRTARWYRIFLTAQIVFAPIAVNETFFALRRFGYQPRCWREIGARAHDVGDRGVLLQHSRAAISAAVVDGVDVVAPPVRESSTRGNTSSPLCTRNMARTCICSCFGGVAILASYPELNASSQVCLQMVHQTLVERLHRRRLRRVAVCGVVHPRHGDQLARHATRT
jgi:hypothetical protein